MDIIDQNTKPALPPSPCFIFDEMDFRQSIRQFSCALQGHFSSSMIGYSVKTNSLPYLLGIAREEGCYAEVVSYHEYALARLCGFPVNRIIYNGPMKSEESFLEAMTHGAIVNIETKRELDWLGHLPPGKNYKVGIRLNVNISAISPEDAKHTHDDSRFGFCDETGELGQALARIAAIPGVKLAGLHIHRTSKTRSVSFYRHLIRYAFEVIHRHQLELEYLDVGGGYYGVFPNKPTYRQYADAIAEELGRAAAPEDLAIIVEPGNALAASAFQYVAEVIDSKKVGETHFVTTNGTRNDVDPLFQKKDYLKKIFLSDNKERPILPKQVISGCTCLEFDRMFELEDYAGLRAGDTILFNNVGAYTMCLSPLFIRYFPRVYRKDTGGGILLSATNGASKSSQAKVSSYQLNLQTMNKNILFCSAGRRGRLLMDFRKTLDGEGLLIATDNSPVAPALYVADKRYTVPRIDSPDYINAILQICSENDVKAITTLIDPEIEILAKHRLLFQEKGILPLCPEPNTAHLCFDKYAMFRHLRGKGIRTTLTYNSLDTFQKGLDAGEIRFPVFMKPVSGSGSVGAGKVGNMEELLSLWNEGKYTYIIQELMTGGDCDADVYVDCISHKPVAAFSKRKIETRIGGASKTISFKDPRLFDFIVEVCSALQLSGPCDMDFFYKEGQYYLSEINPRFGGAYLHAYGAGVDFVKLIMNNIDGKENTPAFGNYDEDVIMMMYDDVIIKKKSELVPGQFTLI